MTESHLLGLLWRWVGLKGPTCQDEERGWWGPVLRAVFLTYRHKVEAAQNHTSHIAYVNF